MRMISKHLGILFLMSLSITAYSQEQLHNSYQFIKDESVEHNSEVLAIYYQQMPISLTVAKSNDLIDYLQTFTFRNLKCISETHCYPSDLLSTKLILLSVLNGEPMETKYGDNTMYVWLKDGIRTTLTLNFTTMHNKYITQVNYAYDSDMDMIVDAAQKSQSPNIKSVMLKTE